MKSKWLIAFLASLLLHLGVLYHYFFRNQIEPTPLLASAVIVEFSNPPQSIQIEHSLPIGPLQQVSMETTVEESKPQEAPKPDLPTVEQESPKEVEPEIVVAKTEKEPHKRLEKPQNLQKTPNKPSLQKKPKNLPLAEREAPKGSQAATAPPSGNSDKIAAEFNSSGRDSSIEANWRGLVKAHLERRLRYPEQALRKRWKGKTIVKLQIDAEGNVLSSDIVKSSGRTEFDREALDNGKRASPLPKPPKTLIQGNRALLSIPIDFDYEKYRP